MLPSIIEKKYEKELVDNPEVKIQLANLLKEAFRCKHDEDFEEDGLLVKRLFLLAKKHKLTLEQFYRFCDYVALLLVDLNEKALNSNKEIKDIVLPNIKDILELIDATDEVRLKDRKFFDLRDGKQTALFNLLNKVEQENYIPFIAFFEDDFEAVLPIKNARDLKNIKACLERNKIRTDIIGYVFYDRLNQYPTIGMKGPNRENKTAEFDDKQLKVLENLISFLWDFDKNSELRNQIITLQFPNDFTLVYAYELLLKNQDNQSKLIKTVQWINKNNSSVNQVISAARQTDNSEENLSAIFNLLLKSNINSSELTISWLESEDLTQNFLDYTIEKIKNNELELKHLKLALQSKISQRKFEVSNDFYDFFHRHNQAERKVYLQQFDSNNINGYLKERLKNIVPDQLDLEIDALIAGYTEWIDNEYYLLLIKQSSEEQQQKIFGLLKAKHPKDYADFAYYLLVNGYYPYFRLALKQLNHADDVALLTWLNDLNPKAIGLALEQLEANQYPINYELLRLAGNPTIQDNPKVAQYQGEKITYEVPDIEDEEEIPASGVDAEKSALINPENIQIELLNFVNRYAKESSTFPLSLFLPAVEQNLINRLISLINNPDVSTTRKVRTVIELFKLNKINPIQSFFARIFDTFNRLEETINRLYFQVQNKHLKDAAIPPEKRYGRKLTRYNRARYYLDLPSEIPETYSRPGVNREDLQIMTAELLYQLEDSDISAGESILEQLKTDDNPIDFVLIPFADHVAHDPDTYNPHDERDVKAQFSLAFQRKIYSILSSYRSSDTAKPIILHGTLNISGNHYVPFFIYKNAGGQIYVTVVEPSAQAQPENYDKTPEKIFKAIFPACIYNDPHVAQQLEQRDCGFNSLQTQKDAITNQLFSIENGKMVINPERLTVNGNRKRAKYYHRNGEVDYIYPNALNNLNLQIRSVWANLLRRINLITILFPNEFNTSSLTALKNKDKYFTPIPDEYDYNKNINSQRARDEHDSQKSFISAMFIDEHQNNNKIRECLERISQKFVNEFAKPNEQDIAEVIGYLKERYPAYLQEQQCDSSIIPNTEWFSEDLGKSLVNRVLLMHLKGQVVDALKNKFKIYCAEFNFKTILEKEEFINRFKHQDTVLPLIKVAEGEELISFIKECADIVRPLLLTGYYNRYIEQIKQTISENALTWYYQLGIDSKLEESIVESLLNQEQNKDIVSYLQRHESELNQLNLRPLNQLIMQQATALKKQCLQTQFELLKETFKRADIADLIGLVANNPHALTFNDDELKALFCGKIVNDRSTFTIEQWDSLPGYDFAQTYRQEIRTEFLAVLAKKLKEKLQEELPKLSVIELFEIYDDTYLIYGKLNKLLAPSIIPTFIWADHLYKNFGQAFLKPYCEQFLPDIIETLAVNIEDWDKYTTIQPLKQLLLDKKQQLETTLPIYIDEAELNSAGNALANLLREQFLSLSRQMGDKIQYYQQHLRIIERLANSFAPHNNDDINGLLAQAVDAIKSSMTGFSTNNIKQLQRQKAQLEGQIKNTYSGLVSLLKNILQTTFLTAEPGDLTYQAYTLLTAFFNDVNFYNSLHPSMVNGKLGEAKANLLARVNTNIDPEVVQQAEFLFPQVFRDNRDQLLINYDIEQDFDDDFAEGQLKVSYPHLTKGMILNCLDFIETNPPYDVDSIYFKLKVCLEKIYANNVGDLDTIIVDGDNLKNLVNLIRSIPDLFKTMPIDFVEKRIAFYLLRSKSMLALWLNPNIPQTVRAQSKAQEEAQKKNPNAPRLPEGRLFLRQVENQVAGYDLTPLPSLDDFFKKVNEYQDERDPLTGRFPAYRLEELTLDEWLIHETHRLMASNKTRGQIDNIHTLFNNEKIDLDNPFRKMDYMDKERLKHFIIDTRCNEWHDVKREINILYHRLNTGHSCAGDILYNHDHKGSRLTYAALYELSAYWQAKHSSMTTLLRPGRWFEPDHKPRVMQEIDKVLARFEAKLKEPTFHHSAHDIIADDDLAALMAIHDLYDRRQHTKLFSTARSGEIIHAIGSTPLFKKGEELIKQEKRKLEQDNISAEESKNEDKKLEEEVDYLSENTSIQLNQALQEIQENCNSRDVSVFVKCMKRIVNERERIINYLTRHGLDALVPLENDDFTTTRTADGRHPLVFHADNYGPNWEVPNRKQSTKEEIYKQMRIFVYNYVNIYRLAVSANELDVFITKHSLSNACIEGCLRGLFEWGNTLVATGNRNNILNINDGDSYTVEKFIEKYHAPLVQLADCYAVPVEEQPRYVAQKLKELRGNHQFFTAGGAAYVATEDYFYNKLPKMEG